MQSLLNKSKNRRNPAIDKQQLIQGFKLAEKTFQEGN